jgi:hypothetical protein
MSVGFGLLVRNANGVGSRFRVTTFPMEDSSPENDSRPLPPNATVIHLPTLLVAQIAQQRLVERVGVQPERL